ncbi:hypothetical protein PHYSODRAFT_255406 [Phytophthora sojae]|uniref:RxLR effector protein n=1 Tax=Phytophthora sojae (strain P6497) TaxID=1094619 RepID=G4ZIZ1_PHYSP|nr:hypothetical protein PHYSODRAFT_255406 [Phytophthora sojae]EGZ18796.1 hypothetical protein PHYSODRAFT_255406 [Phytophthora sojae]|eukprot:XP_009527854.1 hypothetical protein PHYSODRAFT_255406 [Phytophthora sojae]
MIEHAAKYGSTEPLARSLKKELLLKWTSANESPAKALKVLKLDKEATGLASNPALAMLADYVNVWNLKKPNQKTNLMNTIMTSSNCDDAIVARALEAAKQAKASEDWALQLQGFQFDRWVELGYSPKKMPGAVFGTKPTAEEASIVKQYAAYYKSQKTVFDAIKSLS